MAMKPPASLVERAGEQLRYTASAAAAPVGRASPSASVAAPGGRFRTVSETWLPWRRLNQAGVFSPATHANRTTEEIRLVKQAVVQRAADAARAGLPTAPLMMVTSTREGEGKSFIAANLALSIAAEEGRSTVLIDADPSRSAVASIFGVAPRQGLLDAVVDEKLHPSDVLIGTNVEGLYIIPAGHQHALSAELFAGERITLFLRRLVAECPGAFLIFDAPPVLATAEASALARQVAQILYVVEAERIGRAEIAEALALVSMCPHIGFVLNKVRFQFGSVRFGSYYRYYHRSKRASRRVAAPERS